MVLVDVFDYLLGWVEFVLAALPFVLIIRRASRHLDKTVLAARAALALPADDPSLYQIRQKLGFEQQMAFRMIWISEAAILIVLYYTAPQ